MRLVNTFIIAMYVVMNYSLLIPSALEFYEKLNDIYKKNEFHFALEVSVSILFEHNEGNICGAVIIKALFL